MSIESLDFEQKIQEQVSVHESDVLALISKDAKNITDFNVVLLSLIAQNMTKWLAMEQALANAQMPLEQLVSIDGDWFLDEVISLMQNSNYIIQLTSSDNIKLYEQQHREAEAESSLFSRSFEMFQAMTGMFQKLRNCLFAYNNELFESICDSTWSNLNETKSTILKFKAIPIEQLLQRLNQPNFSIEAFLSVIFFCFFVLNLNISKAIHIF